MNTRDDAEIMSIPTERISHLCHKYHIKKLSIFGSTLHGERRPESDLDVLVEFLPGYTPGFAFIRIQDELSDLFHCPIDLHTAASLSRYFREAVLAEARTMYAEG